MKAAAQVDGMEALIERAVPKAYEVEICFFPESGTFLRMRGDAKSLADNSYTVMHQLVFRCGSCGVPIVESGSGGALDAHMNTHIRQFAEAVNTEKRRRKE